MRTEKLTMPNLPPSKVSAVRYRANPPDSYRAEGAAVPSWFEMIFLIGKTSDVTGTRSSASGFYRTFKFRLLRATLLVGSRSFELWSIPRRFLFSNRSVNTM